MNDIRQIKSIIGAQAKDIIAQGIPIEKKGAKYKCPNAAAHKNGDMHPSMSWDDKALQFYCFACGEKIDIYSYYRQYENLSHAQILQKVNMNKYYNQSKSNLIYELKPLGAAEIEYLKNRGLGEDSIKFFKLGSENGNICIPYFNFKQELTGVKIKNLKSDSPKYYSVPGSKFGFFNKQNIKNYEKLIICEGEFDCMTLHEAGYENVVSVGTGANSLAQILDAEKEFLSRFKYLIVLADNDEAGCGMSETFIKKFAYKVKLPDKSLYCDCKDINEVYLKYDREQTDKIVNSADIKIEGLRNLDTRPYEGITAPKGNYIPLGLPTIDNALNDLAPGLVTIIAGRSNSGKSTLVNNIIANAIDKENKVFLISGEGILEIIINRIYQAAIGRNDLFYDYKKINKRYFKEPKAEVLNALKQWHKGKLKIFNKGESTLKTTEELFEIINIEAKISRPDLIVIDNLMSVLSVEKANEKLEKQADFMQRCCDIAKTEKLHIILVCHPNKTLTKNSDMEFEMISGTLDLANKADNIIAVKRNYDASGTEGISGQIEVLKNRYFSELPKIDTYYDSQTGLLLEIEKETGNKIAYAFKWQQYLPDEDDDVFELF